MIAFDDTTPLKNSKIPDCDCASVAHTRLGGIGGTAAANTGFPAAKSANPPSSRLIPPNFSAKQACSRRQPVPAVNNGGYSANQFFITCVP